MSKTFNFTTYYENRTSGTFWRGDRVKSVTVSKRDRILQIEEKRIKKYNHKLR